MGKGGEEDNHSVWCGEERTVIHNTLVMTTTKDVKVNTNVIYEIENIHSVLDMYSPFVVMTTAKFTPKKTKKKIKSKHIKK